MNRFSIFFFLLVSSQAMGQRLVEKAVVKMMVQITFPENMSGPGGGDGGGGGEMMMRMPRDIETNSTIYYKGDKTKVESVSDFGKNMTFTDKAEKKTTTLMEMMGRKMGFYSTEQDAEAMQKRMDSSRKARRDSLEAMGLRFSDPAEPEIVYTEESKKIAGIVCKKALIRTKSRQGEINETTIWYAPDFKMGSGFSMGTSGGGMGRSMGLNPAGMDKINGFPMEYSISRQNGMTVSMIVTKVDLDADIEDKTFDIPKGYDIKPMSEMGGQGGMRIMRMGRSGDQ